jgi:hypothetical protein
MSTTDRLTDEEIRRIVASYPRPAKKVKPEAKPMLKLVASGEPDQQVASVALEPDDVAIVREALAGRSVKIGPDDVDFDKVTSARVTIRWSRPTSPISPPLVREYATDRGAGTVFQYDPYAKERMPGYEPEE